MNLKFGPAATLRGRLRPPSDKSLTHRAYLLGSIASGPSRVRSPLRGEDCDATLNCLRQMGLHAEETEDGFLLQPAETWHAPEGPLNCGNSGTTMRLLSGLIAARSIRATLVGDASLSRRPMGRIADPLRRMGAMVEGDRPPITVEGSRLRAVDYASPVASAQVKSCVLLAGLSAEGTTSVTEPSLSRDHTERMLRATGVRVVSDQGDSGVSRVSLEGGQCPMPFDVSIPADISSAAFFLIAAALLPESELTLDEVGINPTRTGVLDVLDQAGVRWWPENERTQMGEPVADLCLVAPEHLVPFEVSGSMVPRLIDEIPVLAVLATQCEGQSVIRDARELRVKESDRIETVARSLRAMGAEVETFEDGMAITGPTPLTGATIESHGDHRIAMAFAIAALVARGETTIVGAESIATSYPTFAQDLWSVTYV